MRPECPQHLLDIAKAARLILVFTEGRTLEDDQADDLLRSGVERQFMIVGEAMMRIRHDEPDLIGSIPDAPQIISFRNILAHDYSRVADLTVWGIIQGHLCNLIDQVKNLRKSNLGNPTDA